MREKEPPARQLFSLLGVLKNEEDKFKIIQP
jgi:hypothetical protein